jgi:hypothetical protein
MATVEPEDVRRGRLLIKRQARRLDDAYLHGRIRDDLQSEADDADPDSVVIPTMLQPLEEYLDEIEGARAPFDRERKSLATPAGAIHV